MPTIPANVSLIAPKASATTATQRRLPRLAGWMLSGAVAGALWYGAIELGRLVF